MNSQAITFHRRQGSYRHDAGLSAIAAVGLVDDRDFAQLLREAWLLAGELHYFNLFNIANGDWQDFLSTEPTIGLAVIATDPWPLDLAAVEKLFIDLNDLHGDCVNEHLCLDLGARRDELSAELQALFLQGYQLINDINRWRRLSRNHLRFCDLLLAQLGQGMGQLLEQWIALYKSIFDWSHSPMEKELEQETAFSHYSMVAANSKLLQERSLDKRKCLLKQPLLRWLKILGESRLRLQQLARGFMDESLTNNKDFKPQTGLLITILKLYQQMNSPINQLAKQHHDFYLRQVLQLRERAAVADKADVIITAAAAAKSGELDRVNVLPKGSLFDAGRTDDGAVLYYQSVRDLTISHAEIESVYRGGADADNGFPCQWQETDFLKQADNLFLKEKTAPATLGFSLQCEDLGLMVCPGFFELEIRLSGRRQQCAATMDFAENSQAPLFFLSYQVGEEQWDIDPQKVTISFDHTSDTILTLNLKVNYFSIEAITDEPSHSPVLRCLLNAAISPSPLATLCCLRIESVVVKADIEDFTELSLSTSSLGEFPNNISINPFGLSVHDGAKFSIRSSLLSLPGSYCNSEIGLRWLPDLPQNFYYYFYEYYRSEAGGRKPFRLLFSNSSSDEDRTEFEWIGGGSKRYKIPNWNNQQKEHQLDVQLETPGFVFGLDRYQQLLLDKIANDNRWQLWKKLNKSIRIIYTVVSMRTLSLKKDVPLWRRYLGLIYRLNPLVYLRRVMRLYGIAESLNKPLNPQLDQVSLSFHYRHELPQYSQNWQWRYLLPNGYLDHGSDVIGKPLMPPSGQRSYLLIGLKHIEAPQLLSLLFDFSAVETCSNEAPETPLWSYLSDNRWLPLPADAVRFDDTQGLLASGSVGLQLPKAVLSGNTQFNASLYWLRLSVRNPRAINRCCQGIYLNGLRLETELEVPILEKNSISGLVEKLPTISVVQQPYAGFLGRIADTGEDFQQWSAQRLRHKDRASEVWDYEQQLLDAFPGLEKVYCINHCHSGKDSLPGYITIVAIDRSGDKEHQSLCPLLRRQIEQWLQQHASVFIRFDVIPPIEQIVSVSGCVSVLGNSNEGLLDELHEMLRVFINEKALAIDGASFHQGISIEELGFHLLTHPAVDDVNGITLNSDGEKTATEIRPRYPASLLLSGCHKLIMEFVENKSIEQEFLLP